MIGNRFANNSFSILCEMNSILQIASQGILKFCLQNLLGLEQRKAVFKFCDICTMLFSEVHNPAGVHKLLEETNLALAILEKNMPVTIQVSIYVRISIHKSMYI